MSSLDSVEFDVTDLSFEGERDGVRGWLTQDNDALTLHYFPIPPDIPVDVRDLKAVRDFYRIRAAHGRAAIIEVDTLDVDGRTALRTIVKTPQQPHGMTYLGSITIPFRSFSFVLKIQCAEYGTTGIRDTLIADELMREGRLAVPNVADFFRGWMRDPYDPTLIDGFRWNLSEDPKYDARFPTHPLSRLRPVLTRLQGTIHLAEELRRQPSLSA